MDKYEIFYRLHHHDKPLIIGNAWNARSARVIEQSGYDAIGTSSGAISGSMGYDDGEKMPFNEVLFVVKRIAASTSIPLSVDFERGYTDDLTQLTDNVQKLLDIGVVGINIEDRQGEDIYLKKLYAIKNFLKRTNQNLFINARTDGFLQDLPSPLELTIKRAKLYEEAGADGLFVTGVSDADILKKISSSTSLPLNVVGSPKLSSFKALSDAGVKRISMAVLLYKATYGELGEIAGDIRQQQSLSPLF